MAYPRKENLGVIAEGTHEDVLGVKIDRRKDDSIHLTQHHLIDK